MSVKVSIIIVSYKVKGELFKCLDSIYNSKPNAKFEIIVVDNDEVKTIQKDLLARFPEVIYVKTLKNVGFGAGNNLGTKYAKGEYLFFLNPDTEVIGGAIDNIYKRILDSKKTGIVAPMLLDENKNEYQLQGTSELTPIKAILNFSFLHKLFYKNKIDKKYYLQGWDKKGLRKVDVCPGTAFMISKKLFDQINGFDEDFFLYFEEFDLCKKIRDLDFDIYIDSKAKVVHAWGKSTIQFEDKDRFFRKSRFTYFRKHFGLFQALFTETFLRMDKIWIFILAVFIASFILRIYNLSQSMEFIGDQGWFYLSARDLLLSGKIPLVGITSSHIWLHQGPLWTYVLSIALLVFKFNPIAGGFVTALFGAGSAVLMYKLGSEMFSKRVGVIAAVLYAVSPLIIFFERMPFDPSLIPFFTVLYLYALFKWINGSVKYFPFIILLITILYNLELATFTLFFPFAVFILYGFIKRKAWLKNCLNTKIIIISFAALVLPMMPILIYDFSHGFKQTVVFLGWTLYKPFSFLIKPSSQGLLPNFGSVINFLAVNLQKTIFQFNLEIAIAIFIFSMLYLIYKNFKRLQIESSLFILLFLLIVSLLGIIINQTPSAAYLPITIPFIIFTVAIFLSYLFDIQYLSFPLIVLVSLIVSTNAYSAFLISQGNELKIRTMIADEIITLSDGKNYNLIGRGPNSQFESFTMNYEYLLWYKGHPPLKTPTKIIISIAEINGKFIVTKETR